MNNLQLIALYILIIIIASLIKQKKIKLLVVSILALLGILEIVSLNLTDTLIDYRFYTHFGIESIKDFGVLFTEQIIIFCILYLISVYLIIKVSNIIYTKQINIKYKLIGVPIFIFILWQDNGIIKHFIDIYKITHAEEKTFKNSLKSLGINPKDYILPKDLKAIQGKNIIVISVESLEQGFFSKYFNNLVPNLNKYSKEWTFFEDMPVAPGSGWTAGSLFTHQVGLPAFINMEDKSFKSKNGYINEGGRGNNLFQGTKDNKLVGLGNILSNAGYDYRYLMGNIEFAGIEDLLKSYGYKTISEKNSIGKYEHIIMGLNDLDLFNEAKLQIDDLSKNKNNPFALFISTINSHFPTGIYDKRMEQYISKKDNSLEFSIAAADYLIHDFIEYLKSKNLLQNTAIFIFPDHLLMGRSGDVHKKLAMQYRKLYLLTNIESHQFNKKTADTIYQVDVPRLIIDGAGIKTNAKFLFDLIDTNNTIKFIEYNNAKITTLNAAAISKKSFNKKIDIELKDGKIYIKSEKNKIISKINNGNITYSYAFSQNMVFQKEGELPNKNIFKVNGDDIYYKLLHLIVEIKDNNISMVYVGNKQNIGLIKNPINNKLTFTEKELKDIISSHNDYYSYKDSLIKTVEKNYCSDKKIIFDLKNESMFQASNLTLKYNKNLNQFKAIAGTAPIILINKINTRFNKVLLKCIIANNIQNTFFKIYYKNKNSNFSENQSFTVPLDIGRNEIYLSIPSVYINNQLRIDIGQKGEYTIQELSISDCRI